MAAETIRVLVASSDLGSGRALGRAVREALADSQIAGPLDEVQYAAALQAKLPPPGSAYDCLLITPRLADADAEPLIRELRQRGVTIPILAVPEPSTSYDAADRSEALTDVLLAAGASDYLPTLELSSGHLVRRLRQAIRVGREDAAYRTALQAVQRAAQEREELLSIVSHDLRSPLNAIRIAADELVDPSLTAAERNLMLSAVQRSLRRADRMISDLLDASRLEAGDLPLSCAAIPVKSLLEQAGKELTQAFADSGLQLRIEIEPEVGMVHADRDRILQVLDNLLGNIVRHARGSGQVTLSARARGDEVEIALTDRGPGIPADRLPRIFERFDPARRRHRAGVGLGLPIVKGIVTAHGGSITAASPAGQGTSILFTLPRAR